MYTPWTSHRDTLNQLVQTISKLVEVVCTFLDSLHPILRAPFGRFWIDIIASCIAVPENMNLKNGLCTCADSMERDERQREGKPVNLACLL